MLVQLKEPGTPPAFPDHGLCYLQPPLHVGAQLPGEQGQRNPRGQQNPHLCFSKIQGLRSLSYATSASEAIFLHLGEKLGRRLTGPARCSCIPGGWMPAEAGALQPCRSAQDARAPLPSPPLTPPLLPLRVSSKYE